MFHVTYERLWAGEEHLHFLNKQAKKEIKTRGFGLEAKVPSDLANSKWYLAINDIAYSYCPTNRYLYFRKIEKKSPHPTWESYKGRVLDEFIPEVYKRIYEYSTSKSLKNFRMIAEIRDQFKETITNYKSKLDSDSLSPPPNQEESDEFFTDLLRLTDYETLAASSLLNYRISNLHDINMETEFKILFPFDFKLKISSPYLGISGSAEIDFLLKGSILGEIKSIKWHEFYNIGLAGYALAYEDDRKTEVNLGIIICPLFRKERNIPMYDNRSNIRIIAEPWRKMFLRNRNTRMELVKKEEDPGRSDDASQCIGCGFHQECWGQ